MPALALIIPMLKSFFSASLRFFGTWPGAFVLGGFICAMWWGGYVESVWRAREAAAKAVAEAKVREWEEAAKDIAQAATDREVENAAQSKAQSVFVTQHIERLPAHETHDRSRGLFLDPDYISLVRAFDAAGGRSKAASPAGKLREARPIARSDACAAVKIFALRNREALTEANRRLIADGEFYADVRRRMSAE